MSKNLHPINSAPSNLKTEVIQLSTYLMIWWWPQGGHWAVGAGVDIMKIRRPNFPTPGANWKSKMSPWSLWDSGGPRTAHRRRHGLPPAPPQFGKPVKIVKLRSWLEYHIIYLTANFRKLKNEKKWKKTRQATTTAPGMRCRLRRRNLGSLFVKILNWEVGSNAYFLWPF